MISIDNQNENTQSAAANRRFASGGWGLPQQAQGTDFSIRALEALLAKSNKGPQGPACKFAYLRNMPCLPSILLGKKQPHISLQAGPM